ncbi:MAG: tetratricopeptide repeat protein, partial [Gloeotrichia echinulata HAB0833]
MTEKPHASNSNNIEIDVTASGDSKVTVVGQIITEEVKFIVERLEQIPQLESPGVLKAGNPQKSLAYWQGRKTEIAQIQQWFHDQNTFLIGIEGIGGTGKSMLAAKIYEEIAGFPKRFWGDVSNGAGFTDLARQVLTEFGFRVPEQEMQLVDALVKCLRSGEFLLIIDNLESLLQPNRQWGSQFYGDFFNAWVESGGNSKVLVTTRERPDLKGFAWLPLKGLQVEEGVALLVELGIRGDLRQFVALVDGHPLLLRLVADLLKEEYPQDPDLKRLADLGLGNLQQLLTDPQVVGVHRRENVGMVLVLDASFNRLNELQKALLLNISVYRGAVDSAAAAAVLLGYSAAEIEGELRNLVKRSLLVEKLNGKRRFEFQPVVLEYVRYKAGNQTETHQLAIDYYRSIAKQPPWKTKDDVKEYLEIFHHFYHLQDYNSAFDALLVCNDFLWRGYYADQVELYGQLVSKWQEIGDRKNRNYLDSLNLLGFAYFSLGEYQQAIEFQQQSLDISRDINDRNGEGFSLMALSYTYFSLGEYQKAIEFYQQSLAMSREIGDQTKEANLLMKLASVYDSIGLFPQAMDYHEQALAVYRDIGDRTGEAILLIELASVYKLHGQYQKVIDYYEQALAIYQDIDNKAEEANLYSTLASIYESQGQYQQAIDYHEQALAVYRDISDRMGEAISLIQLGSLYKSQRHYQQALTIHRDIGNKAGEAIVLNTLGSIYKSQGQYQ